MYDLFKICNLCLNELNLKHLFDQQSRNHNIDEAIRFVLPELIILQPDTFIRVCSKCLSAINDFYNFKKQCLKNNTTLWSNVNQFQKQTDDTKSQSTEIDGEQETTTHTENSSSENPNHSKQNVPEDDSDLEEDFGASLGGEETSNLTECISLSSIGGFSAQNMEDNNKMFSVNDNQTETNELKCFICNRIFKHKGHLNLHRKIHENIQDYPCPVCGKKFAKKETLKGHMYSHSDIKNFECSICNKKFVQPYGLRKHMKLHTGYDREYECTVCDKKFTLKDTLKRHIKMHVGIKNFECLVCDRKFLQKNHLNEHLKIHTGTKDFECSVCNKKFIQSSTLKSHMKIHAGNKDFQCSVCPNTFLRKDQLKSHLKRKHGIINNNK